MGYNPYLYPANHSHPNWHYHAISTVVPPDIMQSLISFMRNINYQQYSPFEIYQNWTKQNGAHITWNGDLVMVLIDYIKACQDGHCDMDIIESFYDE